MTLDNLIGKLLERINPDSSAIQRLLEAATLLASFSCPNHIVHLCSCGFARLPPGYNSNNFGYGCHWFRTKLI